VRSRLPALFVAAPLLAVASASQLLPVADPFAAFAVGAVALRNDLRLR